MGFRSKIIRKLVNLNEAVIFYPKLTKFYRGQFSEKAFQVLDVGANKGQSIEFFLKINPAASIDAFEPNKKLFTRLVQQYSQFPAIKIHNVGVSNIEGELEFHENVFDETSTFEQLNFDSKYLKKKARILGVKTRDIIIDNYKVDVIRLADFIQKQSMHYDVLKIDVEGHELQVLQGLFTGTGACPIRFIQLESHSDDMYMNHGRHEDIESLLLANGFSRVAEIKHGFGNFSEIIYENKQ